MGDGDPQKMPVALYAVSFSPDGKLAATGGGTSQSASGFVIKMPP